MRATNIVMLAYKFVLDLHHNVQRLKTNDGHEYIDEV